MTDDSGLANPDNRRWCNSQSLV